MLRAANELADVLADDVDENLLNMMGNCMDGAGRKNKALLAKYESYNQRLESIRFAVARCKELRRNRAMPDWDLKTE